MCPAGWHIFGFLSLTKVPRQRSNFCSKHWQFCHHSASCQLSGGPHCWPATTDRPTKKLTSRLGLGTRRGHELPQALRRCLCPFPHTNITHIVQTFLSIAPSFSQRFGCLGEYFPLQIQTLILTQFTAASIDNCQQLFLDKFLIWKKCQLISMLYFQIQTYYESTSTPSLICRYQMLSHLLGTRYWETELEEDLPIFQIACIFFRQRK